MRVVEFETHVGEPIQVNSVTITPISRALQVRFPGRTGGIVWNRPVAVRVQAPQGPEKRLPVHDETRFQQFLLFVVLFGAVALARALLRR